MCLSHRPPGHLDTLCPSVLAKMLPKKTYESGLQGGARPTPRQRRRFTRQTPRARPTRPFAQRHPLAPPDHTQRERLFHPSTSQSISPVRVAVTAATPPTTSNSPSSLTKRHQSHVRDASTANPAMPCRPPTRPTSRIPRSSAPTKNSACPCRHFGGIPPCRSFGGGGLALGYSRLRKDHFHSSPHPSVTPLILTFTLSNTPLGI